MNLKSFFKNILCICIVGILFSNCKTNTPEAKENWVSLYNGKDLTGWTIKFAGEPLGANYKNTFIAADSFIRVSYEQYDSFDNKFAHMYYDQPFSHYKLRFEYRFFGKQIPGGASWNVRNSGVMFHSQSAQSNEFQQHFPVSLEMQLLGGLNDGKDRPTGNMCSPGTNVFYKEKLDRTHCISSSSKTYHTDDWVAAELIVYGDSLVHHLIEGDTVLTYTKPQIDEKGNWEKFNIDASKWENKGGVLLKEGYIALQAESHTIDFKNLRLLDLGE